MPRRVAVSVAVGVAPPRVAQFGSVAGQPRRSPEGTRGDARKVCNWKRLRSAEGLGTCVMCSYLFLLSLAVFCVRFSCVVII